MKTGETVLELGLYATECCSEELEFDTGDVYSRCPKCQARCDWDIQEELMPSENMDSADGIAS